MIKYYLNLNAQMNGDHEIHKETCHYCNSFMQGDNFELLGLFSNEIDALSYAKNKYPYMKIDGCAYCCPNIHKK